MEAADLSNLTSSEHTPISGEQNIIKETLNHFATSGDISEFWNSAKEWSTQDLQLTACDVVPLACKVLDDDAPPVPCSNVTVAEHLLCHLAERCEPKEFLILLIEQAREHWTAVKFQTILPAVRHCINRIDRPRNQSLAFALGALCEYLWSLPVPHAQHLENKECLLLDSDESARRISNLVSSFVDFLDPLIKNISHVRTSGQGTQLDINREVDELSRSLIKVLHQPLGRLDLTKIGKAKSSYRTLAEKIMFLIRELHRDFVRLVVMEQAENCVAVVEGKAVDGHSMESSLGTFVYFAFGERLLPDCIPQVYTHRFLLELCAPLVADLFDDADTFRHTHGLILSSRLIRNIEPETLPVDVLESEELRMMAAAIIKRAAAAKTKELNAGLLRVLSAISKILEPPARAQFLYLLLKIAPSSGGVIGCVIGIITEEVIGNIGRPGRNYFAGFDLERTLHLVFALPSGEKTDLLQNSERIMAALKFLGLVLQKDKITDNCTGVWNMMPLIERNYLHLLRSGIDLSRSHYQLEIRKVKERGHNEPTGVGFAPGSEAVNLPKRQQLGVLEMAVQTFDMMESVVVQVASSIETQRKDVVAK